MLEKPKRRNLLKEHECETCRLHCTFMLTRGILIFILFSLGAPTPTSHFPLHSLAPFSEHPLRYGVLEPPLKAWQPRSTIPGYPHPPSSGISTVGYPQSASPSYPHLQFSDPVTSAVTQLPVIPGYSYPYGNPMRAPLQTPQPQSTSSGDPYLSGPMSSVIHPPVIPGYSSYPYGNYMRAPLLAPQPQSASPGDPHLSGPMSSVIHPPVITGFLSPRGTLSSPPSGMPRESPEVQHEGNPSTESGTRPSY